ncbi:NAD(P)H-binding protein [Nonomuraea typhae]|uniref:NAD(P)H-binding protein n=1 Tax=Nonomuraea typhae TaxID=2603600 RepID=A0ABW7Z499_9ACTN
MSKVVVLGASGRIARHAAGMLAEAGHELTLLVRDPDALEAVPPGARAVQGDVLIPEQLAAAAEGHDVVYADQVDEQARRIIEAMDRAGVRRLVFITSLGIYHELPEPFETWNDAMIGDALRVYRTAADVIETAGLDHTIIRPAWLTDADEIDYEITQRDEQFKGTEVSRKSVAAVVTEAVGDPGRFARTNIGLGKPGTDGPKPAFM